VISKTLEIICSGLFLVARKNILFSLQAH